MEIHSFKDVDECIMAGYRHVKKTGAKVKHYSDYYGGLQTVVGVEASDGHCFVIPIEIHNSSGYHARLARQIRDQGISVIDFINRQLVAFL